jgi:hypothetical protein
VRSWRQRPGVRSANDASRCSGGGSSAMVGIAQGQPLAGLCLGALDSQLTSGPGGTSDAVGGSVQGGGGHRRRAGSGAGRDGPSQSGDPRE